MMWATFIACFAIGQHATTINGKVKDKETEIVLLLKVSNGRFQIVTTSELDEKNSFTFHFTPEYQGIYGIGSGTPNSIHGLERFYFQGNETLNVELTKGGYLLIGEHS